MPKERETWRLVEQRQLVQDQLTTIYENDYELPDGERKDSYWLVAERQGVIVVALTADNEVVMVRQYRPGADKVIVEFPAGYIEEGETDPLARAQAELSEETGYTAEDWQPLGLLDELPHRMEKQSHGFLARNARRTGEQHQDPEEFVRFETVPLARVVQMVEQGELTSGVMLATFLKALFKLGMVRLS